MYGPVLNSYHCKILNQSWKLVDCILSYLVLSTNVLSVNYPMVGLIFCSILTLPRKQLFLYGVIGRRATPTPPPEKNHHQIYQPAQRSTQL